jgi:hypothetical protein
MSRRVISGGLIVVVTAFMVGLGLGVAFALLPVSTVLILGGGVELGFAVASFLAGMVFVVWLLHQPPRKSWGEPRTPEHPPSPVPRERPPRQAPYWLQTLSLAAGIVTGAGALVVAIIAL